MIPKNQLLVYIQIPMWMETEWMNSQPPSLEETPSNNPAIYSENSLYIFNCLNKG